MEYGTTGECTNANSNMDPYIMIQEITNHSKEFYDIKEEMNDMRQQFQEEVEYLIKRLREVEERRKNIDDQLHDLRQLHQTRIDHIKSSIRDQDDVAHYLNAEISRETNDKIKILETRISTMEIQQIQQQCFRTEWLDSTNNRALLMKAIMSVITVLHILAFMFRTLFDITKLFLRTFSRSILTLLFAVFAAFAYYYHENDSGVFYSIAEGIHISTSMTENE